MKCRCLYYCCSAILTVLLLYSCHKEEIKEPVDYRDDCLGTYYCTGTSSGKSVVDTLKVVKITYNDDQIKITGKYINTRVYLQHKFQDIQKFELDDPAAIRTYMGYFTDTSIYVSILDRPEYVGGPEHVNHIVLNGMKAEKNRVR